MKLVFLYIKSIIAQNCSEIPILLDVGKVSFCLQEDNFNNGILRGCFRRHLTPPQKTKTWIPARKTRVDGIQLKVQTIMSP